MYTQYKDDVLFEIGARPVCVFDKYSASRVRLILGKKNEVERMYIFTYRFVYEWMG